MSVQEVLTQVALGHISPEEAAVLVSSGQKAAPKLSMKIGEKGGLSVYGLGRWPVTLYRGQWESLLAYAPEIAAFIQANASKLASKAAA